VPIKVSPSDGGLSACCQGARQKAKADKKSAEESNSGWVEEWDQRYPYRDENGVNEKPSFG